MEVLNLENLPDEAKKEIIQFYLDLIKKYKIKNDISKNEIDEFFDNYNLDITFDREEANARR